VSNKVVTGKFGSELSPNQILINALEFADDMDCLVVAFTNKEGSISSGWSSSPVTSRLGLLDLAKLMMIESISNEE